MVFLKKKYKEKHTKEDTLSDICEKNYIERNIQGNITKKYTLNDTQKTIQRKTLTAKHK